MYNVIEPRINNNVGIQGDENDRPNTKVGNGLLQMSGARRDGRNPSTGSRTSRSAGISTTFDTGYPNNSNSQLEQIY